MPILMDARSAFYKELTNQVKARKLTWENYTEVLAPERWIDGKGTSPTQQILQKDLERMPKALDRVFRPAGTKLDTELLEALFSMSAKAQHLTDTLFVSSTRFLNSAQTLNHTKKAEIVTPAMTRGNFAEVEKCLHAATQAPETEFHKLQNQAYRLSVDRKRQIDFLKEEPAIEGHAWATALAHGKAAGIPEWETIRSAAQICENFREAKIHLRHGENKAVGSLPEIAQANAALIEIADRLRVRHEAYVTLCQNAERSGKGPGEGHGHKDLVK